MNYFYLFVGNKYSIKILENDINSAYEKSLGYYPFLDVKVLSKSNSSIFFDAVVDNESYRCSVSDKSVVNEDELDYDGYID